MRSLIVIQNHYINVYRFRRKRSDITGNLKFAVRVEIAERNETKIPVKLMTNKQNSR